MLKLFAELNATLWWRSLKGMEVAAILFYSFFLLLIAGQFIGVAFTLLFASDLDLVKEIYPWLTEELHLVIHLFFINSLWLSQVILTKNSRLRLSDNRKLLSFGLPINRLTLYLNLAGFFHPVNLLFFVIWVIYLGLMVSSLLQFIAVVLLLLVNYGIINALKWRFKIFTSEQEKWVYGTAGLLLLIFVLVIPYLEIPDITVMSGAAAEHFSEWLYYSPGGLFYVFANHLSGIGLITGAICLLMVAAFFLNQDLVRQTRIALMTPESSSSGTSKSGSAERFIRYFGPEGGKYFYSVWNHPFSKIQFLLTYIVVVPYIFLFGDTDYIAAVFLSLIPVIFVMVMLSNMFGFENRELLLSLQFPFSVETIVKERVKTAIKITLIGSSVIWFAIPYLFQPLATVLQFYMGVVFISLCFLHYMVHSSTNNYKKIEHVSVMSVSNPVIPASVTFSGMFMALLLGIVAFLVVDAYQWVHIGLLTLVNMWLGFLLVRRLEGIFEPFRKKVIPQLWNEL